MPRPTGYSRIRATSREVNSSTTSSCTRNRLAATQASPPLRSLATSAPSTAALTSASANTRNGALPPSSIDIRSTWSAQPAMSRLPTAVDPVKDSLRSRGSASSGSVSAAGSLVGTTLSTPGGRPASVNTSASSRAVNGVSSAGLSTIVQPAAMAGATLRAAIASGKFHGVTSRHGPTGLLVTSNRLRPSGAVVYRPEIRGASSENQRRNSAP